MYIIPLGECRSPDLLWSDLVNIEAERSPRKITQKFLGFLIYHRSDELKTEVVFY